MSEVKESVVDDKKVGEKLVEKKPSIWSKKEKESSKSNYGCEILIEDGSMGDVSVKNAPTDAFIVKYMFEGKLHIDLTRGSKINIFDMYYDKFKQDGIQSIDYGFGTIKPNLWNYQVTGTKKKKRKG
tara:strand:+ start:283 stop:663 length:381 start_codon:yes stop_codon:yes gene_type:complete